MNEAIKTGHRRNRRAPGRATLALLVGLIAAGTSVLWSVPAAAQDPKTGEQPCSDGVVGLLGITGMDCVGCSLTITLESTGWKRAWSMTIEPRITEIAPGSPAAGVLQVGDEIVGVDGMLITSADGGRRLASIEPNQTVTIRYRRHGRAVDVARVARPRCGRFVDGMKTDPSTWSLDPRLLRLPGGIRIQINDAAQRHITVVLPRALEIAIQPGGPMTGRREVTTGEALLGLRWVPLSGSTAVRQKDGDRVWRFSGPIRVSATDVGGPADVAGVRIGDTITAVNGQRIESKKGGAAFSDQRLGQPMRLTLRDPDGRERTVTVVPQARKSDSQPK